MINKEFIAYFKLAHGFFNLSMLERGRRRRSTPSGGTGKQGRSSRCGGCWDLSPG
ncbi:MAG: hypothetical protein H6R44_1151 [Nitrospirae bacterium]|nr:hypothetical protein [Nitrospirota bacterium]